MNKIINLFRGGFVMITQKKFAKVILLITTCCFLCAYLCYLATYFGSNLPLLEQWFEIGFPFFPFLRTSPLILLFLASQFACLRICLLIRPQTFTFWIGIGFIVLAIGYLLLGSFFSIGYFIGGTLLLFHDNTLQFKRISEPFTNLIETT